MRLLTIPANPKIANPNPANVELLSAIPVFGNTFSPSLTTGAFGVWVFSFTSGVDGLSGRGVVCFGTTVTGTSTSTISPFGNLTLTLTLGFWPAVSVVGISPFSNKNSHSFS